MINLCVSNHRFSCQLPLKCFIKKHKTGIERDTVASKLEMVEQPPSTCVVRWNIYFQSSSRFSGLAMNIVFFLLRCISRLSSSQAWLEQWFHSLNQKYSVFFQFYDLKNINLQFIIYILYSFIIYIFICYVYIFFIL